MGGLCELEFAGLATAEDAVLSVRKHAPLTWTEASQSNPSLPFYRFNGVTDAYEMLKRSSAAGGILQNRAWAFL
jgi:hypothetical protein